MSFSGSGSGSRTGSKYSTYFKTCGNCLACNEDPEYSCTCENCDACEKCLYCKGCATDVYRPSIKFENNDCKKCADLVFCSQQCMDNIKRKYGMYSNLTGTKICTLCYCTNDLIVEDWHDFGVGYYNPDDGLRQEYGGNYPFCVYCFEKLITQKNIQLDEYWECLNNAKDEIENKYHMGG